MAVSYRLGRRIAAAAALFLLAEALPAAADPVTVFGAASLTDALEAVGETLRNETGEKVRFSFASSSTLARQIEAGAPADIFGSANEPWMDYLAERDLIETASRVSPIGNRLALIAPADSPLGEIDIGPDLDLVGSLGNDGRLALGDPAHVPAGMYAMEALTSLGLWVAAESRLAAADNVRAALALVEHGEAPLGIVYATDARVSKGVKVLGLFPAGSHKPITYPFAVVTGRDTPEIRAVFDYLTGPEALAVYARFGFEQAAP